MTNCNSLKSSIERYVVDSSVLIDFQRAGLIDHLFSLPWGLVAPDVIVEELLDPPGADLIARGLKSQKLSPAQVEEIIELREIYPKPSTNDLSALILAEDLKITLLTGDRNLREVAQQKSVTVQGTLWVLDQMVSKGALTKSMASEALQRMVMQGARFPTLEVQKRLRLWGGD